MIVNMMKSGPLEVTGYTKDIKKHQKYKYYLKKEKLFYTNITILGNRL